MLLYDVKITPDPVQGKGHYLIEIQVSTPELSEKQSPSSIGTVNYLIDVSESMNEFGKLQSARVALLYSIRQLPIGQRFKVKTFNWEPKVLIEEQTRTKEGKELELASKLIGQLKARGGTRIRSAFGAETGIRVLLTDGQDSPSEDPTDIISTADNIIEQIKTVQKRAFKNAQKSAYTWSKLDHEAQEQAQKWAQWDKVREIYTIGIGIDYNSELLNDLAEKTGTMRSKHIRDARDMNRVFEELQTQFGIRTEPVIVKATLYNKTSSHSMGTLGYGQPGVFFILPVSFPVDDHEVTLHLTDNLSSNTTIILDLKNAKIDEDILVRHANFEMVRINDASKTSNQEKIKAIKKEALPYVEKGKSFNSQQTTRKIQDNIQTLEIGDENQRRYQTAEFNSMSHDEQQIDSAPNQVSKQAPPSATETLNTNIDSSSNQEKIQTIKTEALSYVVGDSLPQIDSVITQLSKQPPMNSTQSNKMNLNSNPNSGQNINSGSRHLKQQLPTNTNQPPRIDEFSVISEQDTRFENTQYISNPMKDSLLSDSMLISATHSNKNTSTEKKYFKVDHSEDYVALLKKAQITKRILVFIADKIVYLWFNQDNIINMSYLDAQKFLKQSSKNLDERLNDILVFTSDLFPSDNIDSILPQKYEGMPYISIDSLITKKAGKDSTKAFFIAYCLGRAVIENYLPETYKVYLYPSWVILKTDKYLYLINSKNLYNLSSLEQLEQATQYYTTSPSHKTFEECLAQFGLGMNQNSNKTDVDNSQHPIASKPILINESDISVSIKGICYFIIHPIHNYVELIKHTWDNKGYMIFMSDDDIGYECLTTSGTINNPYQRAQKFLKNSSKTLDEKLSELLTLTSAVFLRDNIDFAYNSKNTPEVHYGAKSFLCMSIGIFIREGAGKESTKAFFIAYCLARAIMEKSLPETYEVYSYPSWVILKTDQDVLHLIDSNNVYDLSSLEKLEQATQYYATLPSYETFKKCLIQFGIESMKKSTLTQQSIFASKALPLEEPKAANQGIKESTADGDFEILEITPFHDDKKPS